MKIIFKSIILKKGILQYLIIFGILNISLFLCLSIKTTLHKIIFDERNTFENRVAIVKLHNEKNFNIIKQNREIEDIKEVEEGYQLIFTTYKELEIFLKDNSSYFSLIKTNDNNTLNSSMLDFLDGIFNVSCIIISIILVAMIIFNIIQIIVEEKQVISLYKLAGYQNKILFKIFLIIFLSLYSFIYLISFVLFDFIRLIINKLFLIINLEIVLYNINILNIISIYFICMLIILIEIFIFYFYIKKVTPIQFQNNLN